MPLTIEMNSWVEKSYKIFRRNKYLLIFLPALLVVTVFFLVPIVTLLRISFYKYTGMGIYEPAFNLAGYIKFLTDPFYFRVILYTLKNAVLVTFISLLAGYPVAYYVARALSIPCCFRPSLSKSRCP